jgi:hypothetical protein
LVRRIKKNSFDFKLFKINYKTSIISATNRSDANAYKPDRKRHCIPNRKGGDT